MLDRIHIKNIGIIDDVEFEFDDKLNLLTGETGSGKTLIIDSISLATGNRINKEVIRNGEDSALIELAFNCDLEEADNGQIILSRQIFANGKNVCRINGNMTTLSQLKLIGDKLVDIHGQHDNVNLLSKKEYIFLIDGYIGKKIDNIKQQYLDLLKRRKEIKIKREELTADPEERRRKIDLLKFEFDEIEKADLKIDEEEILLERKKYYQNYEKIMNNIKGAYDVLDNQNINQAITYLNNISDIDENINKLLEELNDAYYNFEDVKNELNKTIITSDFDENEHIEIINRLDQIFNLKRKYGNSIKDVLEYKEKVDNEIQILNKANEMIDILNKEYVENNYNLFSFALKIHNLRVEKSKEIEQKVNNELLLLEMKKAVFNVDIDFNKNVFEFEENREYEYNENGLDSIDFVICTNLGSKSQSISKIASGGELSRISLALKTVFIDLYKIPTIIFDEIDTGLSGEAIVALADKFIYIAQKHQVILITHHPNIAAIGTNNLYVEKNTDKNFTKTNIKQLNEGEKIYEIARILSGNNRTQISIEHAKELIEKYK